MRDEHARPPCYYLIPEVDGIIDSMFFPTAVVDGSCAPDFIMFFID
jgi:hypothetical protein